jgi:seryl-tRNA synthetase
MIDLKYIRENSEKVKAGIASKGDMGNVDRLLELDEQRRKLIFEVEELKKVRNDNSKMVARFKKEGKDAASLIEKTKEFSAKIKDMDSRIAEIEKDIFREQSFLPNIPHESVPIGKNELDNVEIRRWGEKRDFDFKVKSHLELGEELDILDFKRGGKISGSGFPVYKGLGARLERALINFMLDIHIDKQGYTEIFPPFVANRESMFGTAQLPKMEEDMYYAEKDDLFLIPTAEVPVTNMHRDEMLSEDELPIKYTAYSACFRREAGSYGKDTRGFLRVHQFNKVEMVNFVKPEDSYERLENLLKEATDILELLEIPYRILMLCSGDLSFAAAKCYDIETWSPAEDKWLEASSVSNFEDFQARRANIRFRRAKGAKPEFVHTLNGSGLATSRLMVSLLEKYQTAQGTVIVPEALRPYMNGITEIRKKEK